MDDLARCRAERLEVLGVFLTSTPLLCLLFILPSRTIANPFGTSVPVSKDLSSG